MPSLAKPCCSSAAMFPPTRALCPDPKILVYNIPKCKTGMREGTSTGDAGRRGSSAKKEKPRQNRGLKVGGKTWRRPLIVAAVRSLAFHIPKRQQFCEGANGRAKKSLLLQRHRRREIDQAVWQRYRIVASRRRQRRLFLARLMDISIRD